jgi:hypothetical protein
MKQYRLLKPLPGCPVGRLFKADENGIYYHIMTEAESLQDGLKMYYFTTQDIIDNTDFFELLDSETFHIKIYNSEDIAKYKLVDTGISKELVDGVQNLLNNSDEYSLSPYMVAEDYDLMWNVIHKKSGVSYKKYKIVLQKYL